MSIDTAFSSAIDSGKIAGAIILACDSKGHQYQNLLGQRTLPCGEKQPFQLNDVIFLASGTKLITSVAALTCVDDGLLALDQPIKTENLPSEVLLSYDEKPDLESATSGITLRHLLTHTSGLVYNFVVPMIAKWRENHSKVKDGKPLPVDQLFCYPLAFQPGSSWMYGSSLDWAGLYIQRVTGVPLLERIRSRVLHTQDADFYPARSLHDRKIDNNPWDDGKGKAVLGGDGSWQDTTDGEFGGHGLFTTAPAYLSVLRSLLKNDGAILKPETADLMFEDHLNGAREGFETALNTPAGPFFRCGTTQKVGYGLGGLLTLEDVPGWYGENTLTWGGGLTLSWFIDRKNDICALCAIQGLLPLDVPLVEQMKQVFRKDIYHKRTDWS